MNLDQIKDSLQADLDAMREREKQGNWLVRFFRRQARKAEERRLHSFHFLKRP
jgi:hypothetical protein